MRANESPSDGLAMAKKMWNRVFQGIGTEIVLNEIGDRVFDFFLLNFDPSTAEFVVSCLDRCCRYRFVWTFPLGSPPLNTLLQRKNWLVLAILYGRIGRGLHRILRHADMMVEVDHVLKKVREVIRDGVKTQPEILPCVPVFWTSRRPKAKKIEFKTKKSFLNFDRFKIFHLKNGSQTWNEFSKNLGSSSIYCMWLSLHRVLFVGGLSLAATIIIPVLLGLALLGVFGFYLYRY